MLSDKFDCGTFKVCRSLGYIMDFNFQSNHVADINCDTNAYELNIDGNQKLNYLINSLPYKNKVMSNGLLYSRVL